MLRRSIFLVWIALVFSACDTQVDEAASVAPSDGSNAAPSCIIPTISIRSPENSSYNISSGQSINLNIEVRFVASYAYSYDVVLYKNDIQIDSYDGSSAGGKTVVFNKVLGEGNYRISTSAVGICGGAPYGNARNKNFKVINTNNSNIHVSWSEYTSPSVSNNKLIFSWSAPGAVSFFVNGSRTNASYRIESTGSDVERYDETDSPSNCPHNEPRYDEYYTVHSVRVSPIYNVNGSEVTGNERSAYVCATHAYL